MDGYVSNEHVSEYGEVQDDLDPASIEKTLGAMKVPRAVTLATFFKSEANPGDTLQIHVPKLGQNEVLVPNSLALIFDIELSGGDADNFLVQNVSRALVSRMVVKFEAQHWKIRRRKA